MWGPGSSGSVGKRGEVRLVLGRLCWLGPEGKAWCGSGWWERWCWAGADPCVAEGQAEMARGHWVGLDRSGLGLDLG